MIINKKKCYQKDILHPKTKKEPQEDVRKDTSAVKSNPIPRTKKFCHRCEIPEHSVRLPSLGAGYKRRSPQRMQL